ncbi:NAD(P)/FAD-dependent oxidoreductase [Sphingobium sp. AS12]|uniref:FAD-dependent oxidoreductase n=1 Tax=Sphingobium sp. AS12 TaxID=2849495 RepID=UPI001C3151D1|nr:FAD-dependent oxidoreductase [Sphingobium sp. AS12]MBV2150066.1 NAD(P)/FAD-dependent oxidoreductase [Sphingobium sp. AS12]
MGDDEHDKIAWEVYCACRVSDTLYALNPFLTQQNFYSQQLRALALVAVLARKLAPGKRNVCIVGAGIAGRTLAAGFASLGASVRLIEARRTPFERYRNAAHRELHPNIIFWPAQHPTPATALPFLNWAQATADEVVEDIQKEWASGFANKVSLIHDQVTAVHHDAAGITMDLKNGEPIEADLAVLATGFKAERGFGTLDSPSYWSPNAVADESRAILVSGSGDGGLIDVLSPILGTRVTRAAHMLAVALSDSPLKEDVEKVEAERTSKMIAGTRDSEDPCDFYRRVQFAQETQDRLSSLAGSDEHLSSRKITLLYQSVSPYSFTAAPINKLLLAYFSNGPRKYVKSVKGELRNGAGRHMMASEDGDSEPVDPPSSFDRVIVRHGAEPAAADLLTRAELASLKVKAVEHSAAADVKDYDKTIFRWTKDGMRKSGVRLEVMTRAIHRTLNHVASAYDLIILNSIIVDECFTNGRPIKIQLGADDRKKAEQLRLFPLRMGPTTVRIGSVNIHRNRPLDDEA